MSRAETDKVFADYANRRRVIPERSTESDRQVTERDDYVNAVTEHREMSQFDDLFSEVDDFFTEIDVWSWGNRPSKSLTHSSNG